MVIAHIATASIPDAVLQYLRAGQATPLAQRTEGHRPLLMMSFLRRLALKAIIAAKNTSVTAAAGPPQYGGGCQDGAHKVTNPSNTSGKPTKTESWSPSTSRLPSRTYPDAPSCTVSGILTLTWPRCSPDETQAPPHTACITTILAPIHDSSGIDLGCPLSPCGFVARADPISRCILSETHRMRASGAKLWAFLDDWYIWIKPQHIPRQPSI